jgi:hypothetical protein
MTPLIHRMVSLMLAIPLTVSSALPQTHPRPGTVLIDTTIRFSASVSGPHYLIHYVVSGCDTLDERFIDNVQVQSPSNALILQQWIDTLRVEFSRCAFPRVPTFIDFNFDGYLDICFNCWYSNLSPPYQLAFFRQYNPATGLFVSATQLNELAGSVSIGEDHTIEAFTPIGDVEQQWIKDIYKYSRGKLVLIEERERTETSRGFKLIIKTPINGVLKVISERDD